MNAWALYVAGAVALFSTAMVVTRERAVHALLYLIVSLLAVAILFYGIGAPFVAALEVIVYAGAIMVIFLFVLMVLLPRDGPEVGRWLDPRAWAGPSALSAILAGELIYALVGAPRGQAGTRFIAPAEVGRSLFGAYFIGVELASMLLLAGLVGALHLARAAGQAAEPAEAPAIEERAV